jgi:hypothetical protein
MGEWHTVYPVAPRYVVCYEYSPSVYLPARELLCQLETENECLKRQLATLQNTSTVDQFACALQYAAECQISLVDTYCDTLLVLKKEFQKQIQKLKSEIEQYQVKVDSVTKVFLQHNIEKNVEHTRILLKLQTTEVLLCKNTSELNQCIRERQSLRDSNRDLTHHLRELKGNYASCQEKLKELIKTEQANRETLRLYKQRILDQKLEIKTLNETVESLSRDIAKSRRDIVDYLGQIENLKECFFGWLAEKGDNFCVKNDAVIFHDCSGTRTCDVRNYNWFLLSNDILFQNSQDPNTRLTLDLHKTTASAKEVPQVFEKFRTKWSKPSQT